MKIISRLTTLTLIVSGFVTSAHAADPMPRWVLASTQSGGAPIAIQMAADHVVLPLTLSSTEGNPDKRVRDLLKAAEELKEKVKGDSNIRLAEARIDRSAGPANGLSDMEFGKEATTSITRHIIVSPRFRGDTFLERAEVLTKFTDKLTMGSVTVAPRRPQLGVINPEKYRAELLTAIMAEMAVLREAAGSDTILHISGLEGPVQARQIDQDNVELFIAYRLTLEQWGAKDPASFPDR